ncbi:hypothetical protein [Clostridium taeniosporum]|uniref:Uncharacterized protein n=1 Tax=Clostridium taeniosporum TaxID=394958 RepID=A0A1D7XK62_9CLOT|nr:hypothetical protein [Clostridium taeniosporum]AOR23723.1 hypothetical protein BGI42_08255 [Clostridium taeniosporum]
MKKDEENSIKDKDIINLINYKNRIIMITSDINEITFTSEGNECNAGILIKERNRDLLIRIDNLYLNSVNQITFDFRGGNKCNYKSKLLYSGTNTIISEDNITICISNNQTVEIKGEENSLLNIYGGTEMPAIGNNEWTAGSGHLIFSGCGNVEVKGGAGCKYYENLEHRGRCGCYSIGFLNKNITDTSTIKILENVNLKAIGGNGQSISSITLNKCSGCGGSAINIEDNSSFEKVGFGNLELIGGDAGKSIGNYACGNCADGGDAIKIKSGLINITSPAILKGGKGGSVDSKTEKVISKAGNGGDCISISKSELDENVRHAKIRIDNYVQAEGGDGGNSGVYFENESILGNDGGNGGNFINSNNFKIEAAIGNIFFTGGEGGKGGCGETIGKNGISGEKFKGDNIYYTEFVKEENEDLYKELDDLAKKESLLDFNNFSQEHIKKEDIEIIKDDKEINHENYNKNFYIEEKEVIEDIQLKENKIGYGDENNQLEIFPNLNEKNKLVKIENQALPVEYKEASKHSTNIIKRLFDYIKNLINKN